MNANARKGRIRLPEPFDRVVLTMDWSPGQGAHFSYVGPPDQLVASGAVEPEMVEYAARKGPGTLRRDSHGHHFTRSKAPDEMLRILRIVTDEKLAVTLPGVRSLFPDGLPPMSAGYVDSNAESDRKVRENPGPGDLVCGALNARACIHAEITGHVVQRSKPVGRFQRVVMWSVIDGALIAPNWAQLVRDRLLGQA